MADTNGNDEISADVVDDDAVLVRFGDMRNGDHTPTIDDRAIYDRGWSSPPRDDVRDGVTSGGGVKEEGGRSRFMRRIACNACPPFMKYFIVNKHNAIVYLALKR